MRQLLCCLGVFGLLAGASLVLPSVGNAQPPCQTTAPTPAFNGLGNWYILESATYLVTPEGSPTGSPGEYECTIPGQSLFNTTGPLLNDLFDGSNLAVSDNVSISQTTSGLTVNLKSETEGFTLAPTVANGNNEAPCSDRDPSLGGLETCDYAIFRFQGNFGTFHDLFVMSDTPPSLGGTGEVPEPSSGLLFGAILPALVGMRRFSKRVSA